MRALSIKQPWASLIIREGKRVENRTWRPNNSMIGQRFAIHASSMPDKQAGRPDLWSPSGAIIGVATLSDVLTSAAQAASYNQSDWWYGPIGYLLSDVYPLVQPIEHTGSLGFWKLSHEVADRVEQTIEWIRQ